MWSGHSHFFLLQGSIIIQIHISVKDDHIISDKCQFEHFNPQGRESIKGQNLRMDTYIFELKAS